ncbi:alpha/beta fold hydrolase [Waterburya agarophytonicola K14]|uniref:Alpha/beta fold hydrolase n=1 Tax=Waterburya agarophytonicola KI4 TaxID=2874699 RepID=A0A964BQF4_9CYAN|nr:alpha/beta fold hydrolase [Waterburya agarophytonicola]MCC0176251.1 alpha/beta fold hydrolase [Waterburya agarophytonicola KI4]
MNINQPWQERIGNQRDWVWRGWQTRYSYLRAKHNNSNFPSPVIIFIHGFGASIEHWRHNLPVISRTYDIYALDLLGFGASRKADVEYSATLWTEQLHDFWQTFIGTPVILVGNSIGSLVCLNATATYPKMVAGLVMLSLPDVSVREDILPPLIRPLVTTLENLVASPFLIKNILKIVRKPNIIRRWAGLAYPNKQAVTDELVEILSSPAYDDDSGQTLLRLSRSVRKASFAKSVKELLPKITIPMLLIWGLQDKMIPPNQAKEIASFNPLLKLIELPNAGHCPHDEYPDEFNSILCDWLESI